MKTVASREAKSQFGQIMNTIPREPVQITKHGNPVAIIISPEEYEDMGGEKARLTALIRRTQREAKKNGLTAEILSELLHEK